MLCLVQMCVPRALRNLIRESMWQGDHRVSALASVVPAALAGRLFQESACFQIRIIRGRSILLPHL